MAGKHILVISQYFYPESFRINDMCREWVKRGYRVTVVTGIPNYPEGRFYKGYGWFKKRREVWEGVQILRLPLISRGKSSLRLICNYLSFVFFGWWWKLFTRLRADLVFTFEVSPMTQALLGVWYARKRRVPHYLYVQDLWPENVEIIMGIKNRCIIGPIERMVRRIYRSCDGILATSPSFVQQIRKRLDTNREKVVYVPQYAEDFYVPMPKCAVPSIPDDGRFKIVFTGNIGRAQGLDILPRTAALLRQMHEDDVCFVIVGGGRYREEFYKDIEDRHVSSSFVLIDRQPPQDVPRLLSACDAAFISFMDNALFANTIPAKLQSYMACAMPILASACGETERILREASCGICCPIGDEQALAQAILRMKAMPQEQLRAYGEASRAYYEQTFSKQTVTDQLLSIFEKERDVADITDEKTENI